MARASPPRAASAVDGEQAYCPACDLKHVRQPDWLCPRCGLPVETEAWRSTVRSRGAGPEPERTFPMGSVVAGVVMVLTSAIFAIGMARDPATSFHVPLVAATVLMLVLGLELLLKVAWARWAAMVIASLALALAAEEAIRARAPDLLPDPLPQALRAPLQDTLRALHPLGTLLAAAWLSGVLLLVAGRPGRARLAAGLLLAAPLAVAAGLRWFGG